MRNLAIGDIHGCRSSLEALADYAEFGADDTIITLGDYVDRGPDSKGVIDFLIALSTGTNLVHLTGNHEIMMRDALVFGESTLSWLTFGGRATLASYGGDTSEAIPGPHWDFIGSSLPYHENETHFFVHANASPGTALGNQQEFELYWKRFDDPEPHQSGKTMVCGHTSQGSGLPRNIGHAICIDTNACRGGWLTCLDTDLGTYWQTNESGDRRQGRIEDLLEFPAP
ncbi:MAG: metallophosphoesterase family protein [Verrucomicrobiales bacterium]